MPNSCNLSLTTTDNHQVLTIPREFSFATTEVRLRKEGEKLIIEPIQSTSLLALLTTLEDISEDFPNVDEGLLPLDDVIL
ncbi:MAG: AbrB/MazE/SpoVT family DNA-binding domain-containing protein [Cyanobacteria bacterium P01_G01_bin.54]